MTPPAKPVGEIPRRSPDESDKSLFLLDPGCVIPERDPKRMKATLDTLNQPLWKRAGLSEDEATELAKMFLAEHPILRQFWNTPDLSTPDEITLPQARCNYGQRTEDPYCGGPADLVVWNTSMASEDGPRCHKHYARVYKSHVCVGQKKPVCVVEGCSETSAWLAWGQYFPESLKGAVCPSHAAEALDVTIMTNTFASTYAIERL